VNLYGFVGNAAIDGSDFVGYVRLGTKISAIIANRILRTLTPWGYILNHVIRSYELSDDENEMLLLTKGNRLGYYRKWLLDQDSSGRLSSTWSGFSVGSVNAVRDMGLRFFSVTMDDYSGWWLNNSANVLVEGKVEARKCSEELMIKTVSVRWVWLDTIDANDYNGSDLESRVGRYVQPVLAFDFDVKIRFDDNDTELTIRR
jgi:hypothetical protein